MNTAVDVDEVVEELPEVTLAPNALEQREAAVRDANQAHKQRWAEAAAEHGGIYSVPRDVAWRLGEQLADEIRAAYGYDRNGRPLRKTEIDPSKPKVRFGTDTHCSHGHAKFEPMPDGDPTWKTCEAKDGKKPKEYCRKCKQEGRERRKTAAQAPTAEAVDTSA